MQFSGGPPFTPKIIALRKLVVEIMAAETTRHMDVMAAEEEEEEVKSPIAVV